MEEPNTVTCTAPVNIAVIKYWGKRNEELILPINSSLSVTLHQDQLKTTTTVATSRSFQEDRIWLNGKEEDVTHPRLQSCLREIRRLARKRTKDADAASDPMRSSYKVHICSVNDFPTAAGLASSAAGFACLVYTLAQVLGVEGELSEIARQGSGSACRSMYGGFVQWIMGEEVNGKDSLAQQVAPETHWPELRVLVLVASAERKPVGSTSGMQTSVQTSLLLKRAEAVVPGRMVEMIEAVQRRDFAAFAELTMKDSNQFHATCLDTYPPIFYLNSVSQQVINLVHRYNGHYKETRLAYTFDAGPNAVIYTLQQHVPEFVQAVQHFFPPETNGGEFVRGLPIEQVALSGELKQAIGLEPLPKGISYVISTKVGPGPCVLEDPTQHLLGSDGWPKETL
ncbi:diphosphomevalonate decarboxylase isoform 3-T3 [Spinachia spinachia]